MVDRIAIDFDTLNAHAGRVEAVSDGVAQAADAAGSVDVADGAFGVLCNFLVPPAQLATSAARNTLEQASAMIARAATQVRATGEDFRENEDDLRSRIESLGEGL